MRALKVRVEVSRAELAAGACAGRRNWEDARVVWSGWASIQPEGTFEHRGRKAAGAVQMVSLPPDADVEVVDRLLIRGVLHQVQGGPLLWRFGSVPLIHVKTRQLTGRVP
ncbi:MULTISPECIES: hypothetical protein [Streptomyces]|uniref:hypothetical protein n=1 Tax=Streptomyces TaxID=1883 RepID=UPI001F41D055|nr:hypothetical protein [Streptomyces sp. A1-5]UJB45977.1 hypothetical protein HRD51_39140 [Streptomyces sp. A1-5]